MNNEYEFIYLGHGIGHPKKRLECHIWFENKIKVKDRKEILKDVPVPLRYFSNWHQNILHFGSDNFFRDYIRENYNEEIKVIFNSNNKELIDKFRANPDEKYGNLNEPTDEEWEAFYKHLDDWLKQLHSTFPIKFFVKLDFHKNHTDWNSWSLKQIPTEIFSCFEEYLKSEKNKNDENYQRNDAFVWILNAVLVHYLENNPISSIPEDIKNKIIYLIENFSGDNRFVDEKNFAIMREILKSLLEGKDKEILEGLPPESLINFFSSSIENTNYLKELSKNNTLEYLKNLILKTDIKKTGNYILTMSENIAQVEIEPTLNSLEIIKNINSNPLLAAQIAELPLDIPDCPEDLFTLAGTIYTGMKKWKKALEVYEKAFKYDENDASFLTGLLYAALNSNQYDVVEKYIELSITKPHIINNPNPLSNIIYYLNTKETEITSNLAIKLVETYWNNPGRRMIPTLYINMTDTYLVANKFDPIFDEIIKEACANLKRNINMYGPIMLENIACYYAMKDDKKNMIHYLKLAKKNEHPNFASLEDLSYFSKYKTDKNFKALFAN